MVRRESAAELIADDEGRRLVDPSGAVLRLLSGRIRDVNQLTFDLAKRRWHGGQFDSSAHVRDSWSDAFRYISGDPAQVPAVGLRRPQIGALHAVMAHVSTGSPLPATVVMPTGTGKTDAMIAIQVAAALEHVLVVVPTDALRSQIAERFETLGLLRAVGVVSEAAREPIVGRLLGRLHDDDEAIRLARACNVVVATPNALSGSPALAAFCAEFSAVFFDEAHHIPA